MVAVGPGPRSHRPADAKREVPSPATPTYIAGDHSAEWIRQKHVEITATGPTSGSPSSGRPALAQPDPDSG